MSDQVRLANLETALQVCAATLDATAADIDRGRRVYPSEDLRAIAGSAWQLAGGKSADFDRDLFVTLVAPVINQFFNEVDPTEFETEDLAESLFRGLRRAGVITDPAERAS